MKLYLKKDYWYHKEKSFAITYTNKFEKIIKYIIHFILDRMPVKFYYVGNDPVKQITRFTVLPYSKIGLSDLVINEYKPYQNRIELLPSIDAEDKEFFAADFKANPIDVYLDNIIRCRLDYINKNPFVRQFTKYRQYLKNKKGYR